jgi:uncharacterized protein YjbI with pentapeptide repeats
VSLGNFHVDDTSFRDADLRGLKCRACWMTNVDFSGADLSEAWLPGGSLRGNRFARARLRQARLPGAYLGETDLTGADLTGADLFDATLTDALLDGADLTAANCTGARGLDAARTAPIGQVGPNIVALEEQARSARLTLTARVRLPDGQHASLAISAYGYFVAIHNEEPGPAYYILRKTLSDTMLALASRWPGGTLDLASVTAKGVGTSVKGKALRRLALAAWREAWGLPALTEKEISDLETSS